MDLQLLPLTPADLPQFKHDLQEAFQKAAAAEFKNLTATVLPEVDIDKSLNAPGAAAYKAVSGGKMIGGAIVNINAATQHNHLDLLYVKCGTQSRGTGIAIWQMLEKCTPIPENGKPAHRILKSATFIFTLTAAASAPWNFLTRTTPTQT